MIVGKGVVIACEERVSPATLEHFHDKWKKQMPGVPAILVSEARIVVRDNVPILFEFTGSDITPTFVAEFQKWWEGVNYG